MELTHGILVIEAYKEASHMPLYYVPCWLWLGVQPMVVEPCLTWAWWDFAKGIIKIFCWFLWLRVSRIKSWCLWFYGFLYCAIFPLWIIIMFVSYCLCFLHPQIYKHYDPFNSCIVCPIMDPQFLIIGAPLIMPMFDCFNNFIIFHE